MQQRIEWEHGPTWLKKALCYRYYRFIPVKTRGGLNSHRPSATQVGQFEFLFAGPPDVSVPIRNAYAVGGDSVRETVFGASSVCDASAATKWVQYAAGGPEGRDSDLLLQELRRLVESGHISAKVLRQAEEQRNKSRRDEYKKQNVWGWRGDEHAQGSSAAGQAGGSEYGHLVLDLGKEPPAVSAYRWATANDSPGRDPIRWILEVRYTCRVTIVLIQRVQLCAGEFRCREMGARGQQVERRSAGTTGKVSMDCALENAHAASRCRAGTREVNSFVSQLDTQWHGQMHWLGQLQFQPAGKKSINFSFRQSQRWLLLISVAWLQSNSIMLFCIGSTNLGKKLKIVSIKLR
jgi:hypothetical protein